MRRQRRKLGNIYEIYLPDCTRFYAREATFSSTAIYDSRTPVGLPIDEVVKRPVLFFVVVMDFAIKSGEWKIVGNQSLTEAPLPEVPPTGIKDMNDSNKFRIYYNDGRMLSATREAIKGLEPAMVWHPERVAERVLDYYRGLPERWKKSQPSYYSSNEATGGIGLKE